jgi:hypothetical protein
LKVICRAVDDAWVEIRHYFDYDPLAAKSARLKLANAILEVAREEQPGRS